MYQFTKDCLTGIEQIDEEHRRLFSMINEGMELIHQHEGVVLAMVKSLIVQLKEYAATHFAHEEEYMEKTGDAELARQKREHEQFTQYLIRQDETVLNEENVREKAEELLQFLAKWLYRHILGSDLMIGHNVNLEENVFTFTKKYETGIDFVDEEHKKLFEIIEETNRLIHEEFLHDKFDAIMHIIGELKDYTRKHFSDEEEYMERIGYEGIKAQRAAHMAFVDQLNQIDLDNVDDHQQEYLFELIDYLLGWLSTHILKMDKKIPLK